MEKKQLLLMIDTTLTDDDAITENINNYDNKDDKYTRYKNRRHWW